MKILLAVSIMLFSFQSFSSFINGEERFLLFKNEKQRKIIILIKSNGIIVSAENFNFDEKQYALLKFKNTTGKDIRILWSLKLNGKDFPVDMDGTTQNYLTIPADETIRFGQINSQDPLIGLNSTDFEKEILINIEIQN